MTLHLLFHGGVTGLNVGDRIIPPSESGVKAAADYLPDQSQAEHVRRDRVYITSDLQAAILFAALRSPGGGDVYAVLPESPVEPDADYLAEPCDSWQCPAAIVLTVVERGVTIPPDILAELCKEAS